MGAPTVEDAASGRATALLEPVAAISYPPTNEGDGDGCYQSPPQRKPEIGHDTKDGKDNPEDLALHRAIVG